MIERAGADFHHAAVIEQGRDFHLIVGSSLACIADQDSGISLAVFEGENALVGFDGHDLRRIVVDCVRVALLVCAGSQRQRAQHHDSQNSGCQDMDLSHEWNTSAQIQYQ